MVPNRPNRLICIIQVRKPKSYILQVTKLQVTPLLICCSHLFIVFLHFNTVINCVGDCFEFLYTYSVKVLLLLFIVGYNFRLLAKLSSILTDEIFHRQLTFITFSLKTLT